MGEICEGCNSFEMKRLDYAELKRNQAHVICASVPPPPQGYICLLCSKACKFTPRLKPGFHMIVEDLWGSLGIAGDRCIVGSQNFFLDR